MNLILPWPPSVNNYWHQRVVAPKGKRAMAMTYISEAGKTFKANVQAAVIATLKAKPVPLDGRLAVAILLHQPDRRGRDIDNVVKPLLDALTAAGVWLDDSQIDRLQVQRGSIAKGGRAEVRVETIREADKEWFATKDATTKADM